VGYCISHGDANIVRVCLFKIICLTVLPVGVLGRSYTNLISLGQANLPIPFSTYCIISLFNLLMPSLSLLQFSYSFFRTTCAVIDCHFSSSGTPIAVASATAGWAAMAASISTLPILCPEILITSSALPRIYQNPSGSTYKTSP
jgi:hypothetical protein